MKNNIKVIIGIVIGITIGAVSGVYATLTYSAGDIAYTKSGASTPISVSSALNELYQNKKETTDNIKNITANGNITLEKYYKNLNVNVPVPSGYIQPSGTKTITTKANNIDVSNYQYANTTGMYTAAEYQSNYTSGYNKGLGERVDYNHGILDAQANTTNTIAIGFTPTIVVLKAEDSTDDIYITYDVSRSETHHYLVSHGVEKEKVIGTTGNTGTYIVSVGQNLGLYTANARRWFWFAVK